jgi:hypothetical protein
MREAVATGHDVAVRMVWREVEEDAMTPEKRVELRALAVCSVLRRAVHRHVQPPKHWPARLYLVHNVIAHPLLALWPRVGEWLHDRTQP